MKKRWKPKVGEKIWYITEGKTSRFANLIVSYWVRPNLFESGFADDPLGVYKTKREAQTALKRLKRFIKEEL